VNDIMEIARKAVWFFTDPMYRRLVQSAEALPPLDDSVIRFFESRLIAQVRDRLEGTELISCEFGEFGQGNCNIVCKDNRYDFMVENAAIDAGIPLAHLCEYLPNLHVRIRGEEFYQIISGKEVSIKENGIQLEDPIIKLEKDLSNWNPPKHAVERPVRDILPDSHVLAVIATKQFTKPMRETLAVRPDLIVPKMMDDFEKALVTSIEEMLKCQKSYKDKFETYGRGSCLIRSTPGDFNEILLAALKGIQGWENWSKIIPNLRIRIREGQIFRVENSALETWVGGKK
jgi:hypothetical protein